MGHTDGRTGKTCNAAY